MKINFDKEEIDLKPKCPFVQLECLFEQIGRCLDKNLRSS